MVATVTILSHDQRLTLASSLRPRSFQTQSKPAGKSGPGRAAPPSPPGRTPCTLARWTLHTGRGKGESLSTQTPSKTAQTFTRPDDTHHELSVRREEPGAVGFHHSVLLAEAELHGEPVQLRKRRLSCSSTL